MEGVLVLVTGACLATAVAVAAWLVHARSPGMVPVRGAAVPAAAARRTASFRLAGVIAGLAAGGGAAGQGALGRGPLLAGPVFGLCVLAGVAAGEISVRPAGGRTRTAAVEVRRVRDYLPRGLAAAVTAAAAVLAALAAAGLIAGGGALRAVIHRARTGADADTVAADDALRRRAARTITGACGILVALPLAGVSLVSAGALLSISCHPAWWTYAGWALLAPLISAVALMGWCAAVLLAPARAATAAPPAR
jgi:hypothetical protein